MELAPLPAAHDALTVTILARAGSRAHRAGGFALNGARHEILDLTGFGEERAGVLEILEVADSGRAHPGAVREGARPQEDDPKMTGGQASAPSE